MAAVALVPLPWLKAVVAGLLVVGHARYVRLTLVSGGHLEDAPETLLAFLGGRTRRFSPSPLRCWRASA